MRLYVCYDALNNLTNQTPRPGGHPCGNALKALREAGHDPETKPVHGVGLPLLNRTSGRAKLEKMTGKRLVPVLELDDGEVVYDSKKIIAWAKANPAAQNAGGSAR